MSLPIINNTANGRNDVIQLVSQNHSRNLKRASANNFFNSYQNNRIIRFIHCLTSIKVVDKSPVSATTLRGFAFALLTLASVQFAHADQSADIDKELNATYQQALKNILPSNGDFESLAFKQSQRDWLKFRNSQCTLQSGMYSPVLSDEQAADFKNCIDKFNTERIKFLTTYDR